MSAPPVVVPASVGELTPEMVIELIGKLAALLQLEVHLVTPGNVAALSPGNKPLQGDEGGIILPLPLKFTRSISDSTATAASVSAQLNLLLAELRKTGQLPS